jgi:hypothetical protein
VKLGRSVFAATFDRFGKNVDDRTRTQADLDAYLDSAYTYDLVKNDLGNPLKRAFIVDADDGSTSALASGRGTKATRLYDLGHRITTGEQEDFTRSPSIRT